MNADGFFSLVKLKSLLPFEKKVLFALVSCGIEADSVSEKSPLGVAVSGGADSVSLLRSLAEIFPSDLLRVISVDHGIRSKKESGGDAAFVADLCKKLGLPCTVFKIESGKIIKIAKTEKKSVEAVARAFRYEAFESFIKAENLDFLCLAHNQNDQCETLLMRFLQGSGIESSGGIERVRGKYVRPLLDIPRAEIEAYLIEKNQAWCTDSTNSDTAYVRNKIRSVLVPVLDENFIGWQSAVLAGAKKSAVDEAFLDSCVYTAQKNAHLLETPELLQQANEVKVSRKHFYSLHDSLKRRVFFSALNKSGFGERFPFRLFEKITSWSDKKEQNLSFENVKISLDSQYLVIQNQKSLDTDIDKESCIEEGFCFLVNDSSSLRVHVCSEQSFAMLEQNIHFPCLVRSYQPCDRIKTADGAYKALADIFSDWKIPNNMRGKIPVVEEISMPAEIKAIIAEPFGYKNWLVNS